MRNRIIVGFVCLVLVGCAGGGGSKMVCGDGKKGGTEVCDGDDLGGATCESLGFAGGTLRCKPTCAQLDRTSCTAPAGCGDGTITAPEICDGSQFGGATCESLGFGAGALSCAANCADYDTQACGAPASCGNGKRDTNEVCDGTDLGGATCKLQGFDTGTLKCASSCIAFDSSTCNKNCTPMCGARVCGPDPVCGTSCGTCDDQSACDASGQCAKMCDSPVLAPPARTLNEDLKLVTVSGEVTLNGATMPNETGTNTRGTLQFTERTTGSYRSVSLGTSGAATYSVTLFAGTYDVTYFYASGQTVLPVLNHGLEAGLAINQNTQKTYDLRTVTVSGEVTLNGATMPDETGTIIRGSIEFMDRTTRGSRSASLRTSGAATYNVTLFAGIYDVTYFYASGQKVLPALNHGLDAGLAISQNMQKTYDLRTVTVSGEVTLNGATMPDEAGTNLRGIIQFTERPTRDSRSASLGTTGAAAYTLTLYAGTYDVMYFYTSGQTVLPAMNHGLDAGLAIGQSMQKTYDLRTVTVSGDVTLNGAIMPDQTGGNARGSLQFTEHATGDYRSGSLGTTGAATYNLTLYAGTYDVTYFYGSGQTVLPALNHGFGGQAINQSTQKTYDLRTATVSGVVTLNGATMPNATGSGTRGDIQFVELTSGSYRSASLGTTGAATYSLMLFAGTYRVAYGYAADQPALPALGHAFDSAIALSQNTQKSYDLQTVTVSGEVTLNGATMPNETGGNDRGSLQFTDRLSASQRSVSLGTTGPASYSVTVWAGAYDIYYAYASGQTVLPQLNSRLQRECLNVPSCTGSTSDVSGTWQLVYDDTGTFGVHVLSLSQQGGTVTGWWLNPGSGASAPLSPGTFRSGSLAVFFDLGVCHETFDGQLLSGCVMTGTVVNDCGSVRFESNFTALRSQ